MQQIPIEKPSAPYGGDQPQQPPPPYSSVVGDQTGPSLGGYPQMGFVTVANTAPPNTYPHPAPPNTYPHPALPNTYPHPPGGYPHPTGVYPQPPGGYPQQTPVNVVVVPPVGTEPVNMYCTSCGQHITTKVVHRASWHTHLIAGIICFSTMFFSMCCLGLVPYCLDSCKNPEHFCPNCDAYLGKYDRC